MISTGASRQKRKRSQDERNEKIARRAAKLNTNRAKKRLLLQEAAEHEQLPHGEEIKVEVQREAPAAWNCSIDEAAVGRFVVIETMYKRPQQRGIQVAQVH